MVRAVLVTLFLYLSAWPAFAQPNRLHVLERVAATHPHVWHAAHRDYPQPHDSPAQWRAELYVRLAAWKMNEEDLGTEHEGRWGVNGKRGDCGNLSQDVISYRLGPNKNKGWDVIGGAGGDNPTLGWGDGFPPSTDRDGCWVLGTPITQGEIDHVMNGGRPFPPKAFPYSTIPLSDAANQVLGTFQAKHGEPSADEIAMIGSWATSLGWNGGDRIQKAIVTELLKRVARYSGDVTNPFPTVTPDEAMRRLNERWQARFNRDVHPIELQIIVDYASSQWDGVGDVPLWLLEDILLASDQYDGSLVGNVAPPGEINPLSRLDHVNGELTLDGEYFEWLGQTQFMLQYEWFNDQGRYRALVESMKAAGVNVARVGITVGTGYLILEPRSGGTFGSGRTRALHPGNTPNFWPRYRAMQEDLARNGIITEVVPFLTAGAYNEGTCGARENRDTSVPQSMNEQSRMAYLEEVAIELLSFRAFVGEVANEYLFIGFCADGHEVTRLAQRWKQLDPEREITTSAYHPVWGDYRTMHMDRHTAPRSWSWILEQLKFPRPDVHTVNDEGINADSDGEFGNDPTPANHWANGILHRLAPGLSYTFHFDRALKGLPPSSSDGSLQAINAWRDGTRAVPFNPQGDYYAVPGALGADAAIARLGQSEGWLLLIGSTTGAVTVPGWNAELVGAQGPHRLYRLTR